MTHSTFYPPVRWSLSALWALTALLIFIMPPSIEDLDHRLARRGSEDGEARALRRHNAEAEMAAAGDYDYAIVNQTDHPGEAVEQIWEIIQAEARRDPPRRVQV